MFADVTEDEFGPTLKGLRELNRLPVKTVASGVRLKPATLARIESGQKPITRTQFEHIVERVCIQSCQPDLQE